MLACTVSLQMSQPPRSIHGHVTCTAAREPSRDGAGCCGSQFGSDGLSADPEAAVSGPQFWDALGFTTAPPDVRSLAEYFLHRENRDAALKH